jgi:hypothetical protein
MEASAKREEGDLRVLDLASDRVTTLPGSVGIHSSRWSPDGRFIAGMTMDDLSLKIFDTETQQWATFPQKDPMGYPEWSKDSKSIYFIRANTIADFGIFRMRVTGGEAELVASLKNFKITGWYNAWLDWMTAMPRWC